jgi:hypothetical protein
MSFRRRRTIALVTALAIATVTAACGGGGDGESADTTRRSTTSTALTTTTPAPPPVYFWPLTGVLAPDGVAIGRPALVVKIDNVEPKARPQVGINQADVVYEERVEGSVTRLMLIFHSTESAPIGPVRSARSTDIALYSPLNRPLFAWSGANDTFAGLVRESNIVDVGHTPAEDQYYRDRGRSAPHNLFINGYLEMLATHQADGGAAPPLFGYRAPGEGLGAGATPVGSVHLVYGSTAGNAPVDYTWTGSGWARSQKGTPHVDAAGAQVAPPNVIVQLVDYVGTGVGDQFGADIPEAALVGEGEAWVLTGGHMVPARWVKPAPEAVTTYLDAAGAPVKLTPGTTWVALVPNGGASITG